MIREIKIFLNCMNSWYSNFIIEELRTDYLPKSKVQFSFMGTIDDSGRPLPYLFEPKITKIILGNNYNQEVFENDIIILNLNDANLEEAEFIIRGLRRTKSMNKKLLIIISNIMTWANTPLKCFSEEEISKYNLSNLEEIPANILEKLNKNNDTENESEITEKNSNEHDDGKRYAVIKLNKSLQLSKIRGYLFSLSSRFIFSFVIFFIST